MSIGSPHKRRAVNRLFQINCSLQNNLNPYRIYFDHNIYDDLSKGRYTISSDKEFILVYSGVTLEEIARASEKYREGFLKVINKYDSEYVWIEDGLAYFKKTDVFKELEECIHNIDAYPGVQELFNFALKLHGGNRDHSFESLVSSQKKAYSDLLYSILDNMDDLDRQNMQTLVDSIISNGYSVFDLMQKTLEDNFKDNEIPNPRISLQEMTGLTSLQLNNIVQPNIIEKIFKRIHSNIPDNELFKSPEYYFDWSAYNVKDSDTFGKINVLFNFLNMMGYWPDRKIEQENIFRAAMSDSQHACYAAYTNEIFTRDEGFAKRLNAVYEYLNIGTEINFITLNHKDG